MENILEKIVANTRLEVEARKSAKPLARIESECSDHLPLSLATHLAQSPTGIIAEFKRKSPSLGWIKQDGRPDHIPLAYQKAGATAVSILTDKEFFGGEASYIVEARKSLTIPILRKDFIVDPYQVYEAKSIGADAILLIAACLSKDECRSLAALAADLRLDVLLEVHDEREAEHFCHGVTAIGVNNRNLKTFVTNIAVSKRLASYLPHEVVRVSESGLARPEHIAELREYGYRGFLMGETFMKTPSPGQALQTFISSLAQ